MSDILLSAGIVVNKGIYFSRIMAQQKIAISAASPNAGRVAQVVSHTTPTALDISGLAALGIGWLENTDAYNAVEIGNIVSGALDPLIQVNAGEAFAVRFAPGAVPYMKAITPNPLPPSWATATAFAAGVLVNDPADSSIWLCAIANTSGVSTMASDRGSHPTWWTSIPLEDVILQAPIFDA
jgi:hypothetical protein